MPTQVRPDDPNATGAARLQSMIGGRDAGTPSLAGKPGVQAGRYAFPPPPALNTAQPGKPPDGARAAMAGAPQPSQPGTPAAGVAPPPVAQAQAATPPPSPGSPQTASAAGSSKGEGAPAAPAPPTLDAMGGAATQTFASPTIPKSGTVAAGMSVQTPYGTVSASPTGQKLALDAAGQQKYKESMAALRSRFTVPRVMKGMTGLPEMDLKLGASNFDPFSGRFHGRE